MKTPTELRELADGLDWIRGMDSHDEEIIQAIRDYAALLDRLEARSKKERLMDAICELMDEYASDCAAALLESQEKDARRLDWLEKAHTLHYAVEFLYVIDGYMCRITYDGDVMRSYNGETLRTAIDAALASETSALQAQPAMASEGKEGK